MSIERIHGGAYMNKKQSRVQDLVICALFSALIAIGAFLQITIPVQPMPMHFTLQYYFSILAGFLLGGKRGLLSVLIYLLIGLVGIPVFASGGGPAYLIRPTFGFLLGFAFNSGAIGYLCERWLPKKGWQYLIIATVGYTLYYLCGMIYFYVISNYVIDVPVGWGLVFINCFVITAVPDYLLCIFGALTAYKLLAIVRKNILK